VVPPGSLVVGMPARVVRTLDAERQAAIVANAGRYVALARAYRAGQVPRRRSAGAEGAPPDGAS
jgi:carbonic anhydrase/acetyltransferase-like protein (isoleucine patch superfamily)